MRHRIARIRIVTGILHLCNITESGEEAGVLDGGVVSRTGIGDGAYGVYKAVNEQDQVVGVKLCLLRAS